MSISIPYKLLRWILVVLLAVVLVPAQAQQNLRSKLSGQIKNKFTGLPLSNVNVYMECLKTGTTTNEEGYYDLEVV